MTTQENDLVLDSFLGSGTTAATAHKLGRKWICIELGEHIHSHCQPRLQRVIDGEDTGGITEAVNWQGGGGFRFFRLAPSLLKKDKFNQFVIDESIYNANMLAAAVAKLNSYFYAPHETIFWKQGTSGEHSYIFTTTEYLNAKLLDEIAKELELAERLLICCPAFDLGLDTRYDLIEIKKIPKSVLDKCEYAKDNYNLNVIDVSEFDDEDWEEEE
ncbi:MAG: DNA methyltransferase [Bacillota bacterium]